MFLRSGRCREPSAQPPFTAQRRHNEELPLPDCEGDAASADAIRTCRMPIYRHGAYAASRLAQFMLICRRIVLPSLRCRCRRHAVAVSGSRQA